MGSDIQQYLLSKHKLFGIKGRKITIKPMEEAFSNSVFNVSAGSKQYILKVISDPVTNEQKLAEKEATLLRRFKNIAPKMFFLGMFGSHPAILMERVRGKSLNRSKPTKTHLEQLAEALALIHSTKADPRSRSLLARKYLKVPAENLDGTVEWLQKFKDRAGLKAKLLKQYMRLHEYYLNSNMRFTPVICHGDFKLGNILKSGRQIKIIDWEGAIIGDPAFDVAVLFYTADFEFRRKRLSEEGKRLFLARYLDLKPDDDLERRLHVYYNLARFEDMCWSVRDFLGYRRKRYLPIIYRHLGKLQKLDLRA